MIKVLSSGFFNTIQDLGRFGYGELGVPVSGAMDMISTNLANNILKNNANDAILEITLGKTKLLFDKQTVISITGADFLPELNGVSVPLNTALIIQKGDMLTFHKARYGVRCYLAVKGGFQTDIVLGSRSFYKDITPQNNIKKNDELPINLFSNNTKKTFSSVKINPAHFSSNSIEVYKGPEYDLLSDLQKERFSEIIFTISKENSRMGYRLNEHVENDLGSLLTSCVLPGTVQLTPSGKIIILMRDCQVTGGYPRVLQLTENAINQLAQKSTGDTFKFTIVPLA